MCEVNRLETILETSFENKTKRFVSWVNDFDSLCFKIFSDSYRLSINLAEMIAEKHRKKIMRWDEMELKKSASSKWNRENWVIFVDVSVKIFSLFMLLLL